MRGVDYLNGYVQDGVVTLFRDCVSAKIDVRSHPTLKGHCGVFAREQIDENEFIGCYAGHVYVPNEERDWNPYVMGMMFHKTYYYIDALWVGNEIRWINDCRGVGTQNVEYTQRDRRLKGEGDIPRCEIWTIRTINAGEELLVAYGKEYWDTHDRKC